MSPLDPKDDPDRYDPDRVPEVPEPQRGLDPRYDPDRFDGSQDLTDLIGKQGAFEDERDNLQWLVGLLAVFGFLAAVAFLFQYVLSP